jgi:inosine-uridine nucleoside N-ribohydrolase
MAQKVVFIADPGIDTSFALALAFRDPQLEVVGLLATAGNVSADQASQNIRILIDQLEVAKWPRLGAALTVEYPSDGTALHGPDGLGGLHFPPISLHNPTPGDKVLVELARQYPNELAVVVLGPCTVLARAYDRDSDLPTLLKRVVVVGGAWHDPGNSTAVAEFHIHCDPLAARQVLRGGGRTALIPLDVTRKLVYSPSDLLHLPNPDSPTCQFLRRIVPYGIRASSNLYGIEGLHLKDVLGVVAVALPQALTLCPMCVDIEVRGELTRGMCVVDSRPTHGPENVEWATAVDVTAVRSYITRTLGT